MHGVLVDHLCKNTLDYHMFDWYQNLYTGGTFVHFAPGQFSTFFSDIVQPTGYGRFHFAGKVVSHHHAWVAGALDSVVCTVDKVLLWDFMPWEPYFKNQHGRSYVFKDDQGAAQQFVKGLFLWELEAAAAASA